MKAPYPQVAKVHVCYRTVWSKEVDNPIDRRFAAHLRDRAYAKVKPPSLAFPAQLIRMVKGFRID